MAFIRRRPRLPEPDPGGLPVWNTIHFCEIFAAMMTRLSSKVSTSRNFHVVSIAETYPVLPYSRRREYCEGGYLGKNGHRGCPCWVIALARRQSQEITIAIGRITSRVANSRMLTSCLGSPSIFRFVPIRLHTEHSEHATTTERWKALEVSAQS